MAYYKVPHFLPQLNAGEKAVRTAYKAIGYCRRVARKKGFSEDPAVCRERLRFVEDGVKDTGTSTKGLLY